jgi:hypothetical protein
MRLQDVQAGNVVNTARHADMHLQYDYITTRALWITHVAPLQCQVTPQHDVTLLTKCSVAGDKTRRVHTVEDIIYYSYPLVLYCIEVLPSLEPPVGPRVSL